MSRYLRFLLIGLVLGLFTEVQLRFVAGGAKKEGQMRFWRLISKRKSSSRKPLPISSMREHTVTAKPSRWFSIDSRLNDQVVESEKQVV